MSDRERRCFDPTVTKIAAYIPVSAEMFDEYDDDYVPTPTPLRMRIRMRLRSWRYRIGLRIAGVTDVDDR